MWLGKAHLENLPILRSAMPMSGCPRWLTGKESGSQYRRHGLDPWVRKIPWRKKWQPTPVFLPGESHGQRSLAGYSPWHCKGSDMTEWVTHSQRNIVWCLILFWGKVLFSKRMGRDVGRRKRRDQKSQTNSDSSTLAKATLDSDTGFFALGQDI